MTHSTELTQPLTLFDHTVLQPGTVLVTKSAPPASWARFSAPVAVEPKQMVVNPAPVDDDLEELRADYTELSGDEPDKRWGAKRLRDELEALANGG